MWRLLLLFDRSWWAYLFEPTSYYADRYCSNHWLSDRLQRLWCRMRGHPAGTIYYNPGGLEPNNHCKHCGDDIG